jgi:hypothetical protein
MEHTHTHTHTHRHVYIYMCGLDGGWMSGWVGVGVGVSSLRREHANRACPWGSSWSLNLIPKP